MEPAKKRRIMDIHAHILPGVDDGSRSMEESCHMLHMAAGQGIYRVIATPHRIHKGQMFQLREQLKEMEKIIRGDFPDFALYLGQENFYHEDLLRQLSCGEALTMADSRYVLVEFSPGVSYRELYRAVRQLLNAAYWPILAHMERYACLREEKNLDDLQEGGCLLQMNYSGLSGQWFHLETRWRRKQVLSGRIDFLGTDMHRLDYRPPEIKGAVKWLENHAGEELMQKIMLENPLCILNREWISRRR